MKAELIRMIEVGVFVDYCGEVVLIPYSSIESISFIDLKKEDFVSDGIGLSLDYVVNNKMMEIKLR